MNILALDTSTDACSAALLYDNNIKESYQLAPQQHSSLIIPMLESLLAEAELTLSQLDAIAFGRGPGSFTGVRIAASVTQGMAFAYDLPVIPISTLQALAQGVYREFTAARVLVAMDARMQEVYWGAYQVVKGQHMETVQADMVVAPIAAPIPTGEESWVGVGNGWSSYEADLQQRFNMRVQTCIAARYPRAYDIAQLAAVAYQQGKMVSAEQALPVYLRESVAQEKRV